MKLTKWQGVIIACMGITAIAGLVTFALSKGQDGVILASGMTLIGAIVGGALGFTIHRNNKG